MRWTFPTFSRCCGRSCGCRCCAACAWPAANFVKMQLVDRLLLGNAAVTPMVCLVVCLTILFVVVFAKCVGCSLPHPGREDRPGPGGDGQPLHLHHCGRHQPADLFPLRLLVPAVAAYRKRRRSPASFYLQLSGLIQLGFAAVTGGGCGVGCNLLRRQGAADLAGSPHDHGPVGDHGPLGH